MTRRPPTHDHSVHILTPTHILVGQLETVGPPLEFLNDPLRDGLILKNARVAPLNPDLPLKDMTLPQVTLRRQEIIMLMLTDPESQSQINIMHREEALIVYTPLTVVRANFHLPAEARITDFLSSVSGELQPVSDVNLFLLFSPPLPFPEQSALSLIGRQYIQFYHEA